VAEFLIRFTLERPVGRIRKGVDTLPMDTPMKYMIIGLSVMAVLLFTRSVYRVIELAGGWSGRVISTQWLFGSSARHFLPSHTQKC
jgi:RTA1 like protein